MFKIKIIIILIIANLITFNCFADSYAPSGSNWYGPYTITKVTSYIGDNFRTMVHVKEAPNTTCSVTNDKRLATLTSKHSSRTQAIFSAAASAQAQQKKVMLLLGSACNSYLGLTIHAVEILSE